LGSSKYSSGSDQEESIHPNESSSQRSDVGQSHKYRHCEYALKQLNELANQFSKLFKRIVRQYDGMRKRNAFMEGYKKTAPFADNLNEFDEAREVVTDLIAEYEAAEDADYLNPDAGKGAEGEASDKRAP
jgi:transposase-like protein